MDKYKLATMYTCHSTTVGQMVTYWAGTDAEVSIYEVLQKLAEAEDDQGRELLLESYFLIQGNMDKSNDGQRKVAMIRFFHKLEKLAAQSASCFSAVRLGVHLKEM
jgi:hypothetical protein